MVSPAPAGIRLQQTKKPPQKQLGPSTSKGPRAEKAMVGCATMQW